MINIGIEFDALKASDSEIASTVRKKIIAQKIKDGYKLGIGDLRYFGSFLVKSGLVHRAKNDEIAFALLTGEITGRISHENASIIDDIDAYLAVALNQAKPEILIFIVRAITEATRVRGIDLMASPSFMKTADEYKNIICS